jgi:NDP-sugar pyrophosphorylase family protein
LANGLSVMGYHMQGGWIDIGAMADYYRACEEFEEKGEE